MIGRLTCLGLTPWQRCVVGEADSGQQKDCLDAALKRGSTLSRQLCFATHNSSANTTTGIRAIAM